MALELPLPRERFEVALDDGARIRVRCHGNPGGVRLFLSHGNGFAINAYLPFWQLFLDRYDVILFDFRNHGENDPVSPANHTYEQLARDLERVFQAVTARLGARPSAGLFHSMSARGAMKHALATGFRWNALVLFDPPNVPPPLHPCHTDMEAFEMRLVTFAKGRRRHFDSPGELAADFAASRMGRGWVAGAHELMARAVLRRSAAGGYDLVCDPANEAGIDAEAMTLDLWPRAADFGGPVKLVGADPALEGTPPTGRANRALATDGGYDYDFVAGTGHMLQIEKPNECARLTLAFLHKCGLG
jgi:pimeloyl-ACP methyl ester carboxylesterase